jgi:nucleotide-binding universal stress UspA family protein
MKILIGYDGSKYADEAVSDLGRAGLPAACEVTILSVAEVWMPPPPPSSYEMIEAVGFQGLLERSHVEQSRQVEQAEALAFQASRMVQSRFPSWRVYAAALSGSPSEEIVTRAEEWGADLIVVGAHGHQGLGRLLPGSVSQRVVTDADCSVRVGRAPRFLERSPRVLIGVDGSLLAEEAVKTFASRNWPPGTEVRLVTSINPMHDYPIGEEEKAALGHYLQRSSLAQLSDGKLPVSSVVIDGPSRQSILEEAEKWQADLIMLGAKGHSRLSRLLLGSVSTAVTARAHCSVEIVRKRADSR